MADMMREQLRAADADRQGVADRLRTALEEGRLDLTEYDERLRDAYAAKTYGELDRLLTDLPTAAAVVPARPGAKAGRFTRAWLAHVWGSWARVAMLLTGIWAAGAVASGEILFYWPVWVVGPWGVLLVHRTVGGLRDGAPRRRAAEVEHRRRLREHKRERKGLYREAIAAGDLPANPSKQQRRAFIAEAMARGDLTPKPRRAVE